MVLALDLSAVLIDLGNGDLNGSVVLGLDDAVGGAALSGDVPKHKTIGVSKTLKDNKLHEAIGYSHKSTISPLSFSIFAACRL